MMSSDSELRSFLLERLGGVEKTSTKPLIVLSRRAFLGGLAFGGAAADARFTPVSLIPVLRWKGSVLTVQSGQDSWSIDRAAFGPGASLRALRQRQGFLIRLRRAVMPGTSLLVNFDLAIFNATRGWRAELTVPGLHFAAGTDLRSWLRGVPVVGHVRAMEIVAGAGSLRIASGRVAISSASGLSLAIDSETRFSGPCQCTADGLNLALARRSENLSPFDDRGNGWATCFDLRNPTLRQRAFACGDANAVAAVRVNSAERVSGEFFAGRGGRDQGVIIEGPARLELRGKTGAGAPLRFDRAVVAVGRRALGISGIISADPFATTMGGLVATCRGNAEEPFCATFAAGETPHYSAKVLVSGMWLQASGADAAVLTLPDRAMILATAADPDRTLDKIIVGPPDTIIGQRITSGLNGGELWLRSGRNLLDLRFRFEGFHIDWNGVGAPHLVRETDGRYHVEGLMRVELPPQHLSETILDLADSVDTCPTANGSVGRPSASSWIVFNFPREPSHSAKWKRTPLTVEALTKWDGLEMAVDSRALSTIKDDDLDSQLGRVGIGRQTGLKEALDSIDSTIRAPGLFETSLELADSLIFSPSENAVWERTPLGPGPSVPLFGLRIGGHGTDARLRALSSRFLPRRGIPTRAELLRKQKDDEPLSARHHWEIIGQTSVYGLPALRRITADDDKKPDTNPDNTLKRVPQLSVVRPVDDYKYLKEVDLYRAKDTGGDTARPAPETGIALASAFDTADVTLTSLGATMRLDWRGEPAKLLSDPAVRELPVSFSLERLAYQAWLGRDVRVIAVDKGYLLPLGVRASLVLVAERVFLPGPAGPIAKEISRRFITTAPNAKHFPAVNQPDGGRDFPVSMLTMLTTRTPDLVTPEDEATGLIPVNFPSAEANWAFWPRFRTANGLMDVEWKSRIDDDTTPLVNKMIFILNAAAGEWGYVKQIVAHYNNGLREKDPGRRDSWPARNVARLGGARRVYAPRADMVKAMRGRRAEDNPPPDTAFDTDSWLLVARGRSSGPGGPDEPPQPENFVMDARMNGADQPPFYPSVRRAAIAVQSIDRLVGTPQGLIEARPYPEYVNGGFEGDNKGEIFLDVMWPEIRLDPAAAEKPVAGGLAKPATMVAAMSRISGIVGGTYDRPPRLARIMRTSGSRANLLPAPAAAEESLLYFGDAADGSFNPGEFFKLKVFGLDLLKGVEISGLENAPRLSELVDYGASQARKEQIQTAARGALEKVRDAKVAIRNGIKDFNTEIATHVSGVTFATLYPELAKAFDDAIDTLIAQLAIVASDGALQTVATAATRISAAAKPLMSEIGRVTRDPIPPVVNAAIAEIIGRWNEFEALLRNLPAFVEAKLQELVTRQLEVLAGMGADYLALLFGLKGGETIPDLLSSPEARSRLGETLLYEQLGEPILRMLLAVERFVIELKGAAVIAKERVRDAAESAIHTAVRTLAGRIVDDLAAAQPNILREQDVERLAVALADAADAKVRALTDAPDLQQALVRLRQVQDELSNGRGNARREIEAAIRAEIDARRDWLRAADATDEAAAFAEFATAVVKAAVGEALAVAKAAVDRVLHLIESLLQNGFDALVAIALDALNATLDGASSLQELARISRLGRTITGWCTNAVDGALGAVKALGDKVLAPHTDIDAAVARVATSISAIQVPMTVPAPVVIRFEAIRSALLRATQAVAGASAELRTARERLEAMTGGDTCATTAAFAAALGSSIVKRSEAVAALRGIMLQVRALDRLVVEAPGPADAFKNAVKPHLDQLVRDARALISGLSVVGRINMPGVWKDVIEKAKDRIYQEIDVPAFRTRVDAAWTALIKQGTAIQNSLATATAEQLVVMVESTVALAEWDRRFAGLLIETIALGNDARGKVEAAAFALITGSAQHLLTLHVQAYGPLKDLRDHIARYPTVTYLLGAQYQSFAIAVGEVETDIKLLGDLAGAKDFAEAATRLVTLKNHWNGGTLALSRAVTALAAFIDALLKGQLGRLLADRVREEFALLEQRLRDIIAEFVPARITTKYDWNTSIGDLDAGLFKFSMTDGKSDDDLVINSIIEFNLLSGQRSATVEGALKKFTVELPDLFTLNFRKGSFSSVNGSNPDFKVDLDNVVLGSTLEFLQELQSLFAPSGNGFYVQPGLSGIKVGYGFARDRTQVGTLTLSNIALDIYVDLPFDSKPVQFGFLFASKVKPFLISNPPYGGGGWVRIIYETDKSPNVSLSFMFGAVTDIQFGPLKGQGRICAGMWWEDGALTAFVEAVGEGSIACFSISILIGIYLTYRPADGSMFGKARLEFKFRVGFVTFKYKVEAGYKIAGKGGGERSPPLGGSPPTAEIAGALMPARPPLVAAGGGDPAVHFIATTVPPKSFKWRDYQKHLSLELLND